MTIRILSVLITAFVMLGMLIGCNGGDDKESILDKVESVAFDKHEITIEVGESANINATIKPNELSDAKLIWKSSDESIAIVSRGLVTAVSAGNAVITAVADNGELDSCIVTVIENDEPSNDEDNTHNNGDDKNDGGHKDDDKPGDNSDNDAMIGSEIGNKCPNFSAPLIGGDETVDLDDYIGKKVIINLWGTWCGPCKAELPHFDQIAEEFDGEVVVLTIHSTYGLENAANYINNNFPDSKMIFAHDTSLTEFHDKCFVLLGGTDYYPRTIILDENGIIRFNQDGAMSYSQITDVLDSLAPDDEPVVPETTLASYTLRISTVGGMPMANLPIYVFEYEDGELGDLVDGGWAITNENGSATFTLPGNKRYAARIDVSVPYGYNVESHYLLSETDTEIVISSAVITETIPSGFGYKLGDIMYDFTVTTTDGNQFTLSEVLKDKKAVLINFWYDSCYWCEVEFPIMQEVYEKYSDDLAIIALTPPFITGSDLNSASQYQDALGLTFDVAIDNDGLYSAFGVEAYPTSIVIDRYGVICFIEPGAITSQRDFEYIFEHFIADDYEQKLVVDYKDIVPDEKTNLNMPSSEDMSKAFDNSTIVGIQY